MNPTTPSVPKPDNLLNASAPWITAIRVNKLKQLADFSIEICDDTIMRHLFLTGPNGSGKTTLLRSLRAHLEKLAKDRHFQHSGWRQSLTVFQKQREIALSKGDAMAVAKAKKDIAFVQSQVDDLWSEVDARIARLEAFPEVFEENQFIIAFYKDVRVSSFKAPRNPEKPDIKHTVDANNGDQFLKFLVDLKVQQALAVTANNQEDAATIDKWFLAFRSILRSIFKDEALEIGFDYKDYSFTIQSEGRSFPFTELSAGYAAVLDIVADLILKMQDANRRVRVFNMPGIVLIDEVETHLHMALQKEIMPILTQVFPKIQFIVSTHSPFVLNSISNATVYDLQRHECVQNLTEYSYESLAEGFFGVETDSGELHRRLKRMEMLIEKPRKSSVENDELESIMEDFEKVPDGLAPLQKARFNDLKRVYLLSRNTEANT